MKRMVLLCAVAAFTCVPLAAVFAGGAGGVLGGHQLFDPRFASGDYQERFSGGFGYGVTHDGRRIGGFGMAIYSNGDPGRLAGGVGGLIMGQELRLGGLCLATNLWTGIGGLSVNGFGMYPGCLIGFAQLDVEAGVAVFPWFQVSVYGGMQVMGNLAPGRPFADALYYSPVIGIRTAWGAF
jgi:hypothetical protein